MLKEHICVAPVNSNPPEEDEASDDGELAPSSSSDVALTGEEVAKLVELLPPEQRVQLIQTIEQHQGWLPPPRMLAEYDEILPGLAERIVAMPEREQAHRHSLIEKETSRQFRLRQLGQHYALLGMALLLSFSVLLTLLGDPAWGGRVAIFTIVAVVGIFVTGKVADAKASDADSEEATEK